MICSLDWTYTGLSNLVLFRSCTCRPVKLGSIPFLHLKASQTWFCSGLTLENQSNLVLILSYVYLLGLILHCQSGCAFDFATHIYLIELTTLMPNVKRLQIQLSWDLGFFENPDLFEISFFLPEGFSKAFIGCKPFFTLYSCFKQKNIYLIQCVMQCMIMSDMFEYLNLFFIWICFVPLF